MIKGETMDKEMLKVFGSMWLLALVLNVAFWGALIYVGLLLLRHFGVI